MRVEDLKRWHWAIIGLALGLIFSLVRGTTGAEESLAARTTTLDSSEMENLLLKKSESGKPLIKDIGVYRVKDGSYWLAADQLVIRDKEEEYVPVKVWTEVPYVSRSATTQKSDPNYTVVSYLQEMKAKNPEVDFSTRWWAQEPVRTPLYAVVGLLLFGGLVPIALEKLIGAGYGKRSTDPQYDLSRFGKGQQEPKAAAKAEPSEEEMAKLHDLEAELEKNLARHASGSASADAAAATAQQHEPEQPVKKLEGGPLDVAPEEKPKEDKNYAGEFYPTETHVKRNKG